MVTQLTKVATAALVLAVVAAIVVVTVLRDVEPEAVVAGLFGLANLLLGAGAVAHGVNQGSSSTAVGVEQGASSSSSARK